MPSAYKIGDKFKLKTGSASTYEVYHITESNAMPVKDIVLYLKQFGRPNVFNRDQQFINVPETRVLELFEFVLSK